MNLIKKIENFSTFLSLDIDLCCCYCYFNLNSSVYDEVNYKSILNYLKFQLCQWPPLLIQLNHENVLLHDSGLVGFDLPQKST